VGTLHTSALVDGSLPASLGAVLTVAAFSPASTQAQLDSFVLTVSSLTPMVVEQPPLGLQFSTDGIVVSAIPLKTDYSERHAATGKKETREVRPQVKEFLKRVVVPILVERYIALQQTKSLARTPEAV